MDPLAGAQGRRTPPEGWAGGVSIHPDSSLRGPRDHPKLIPSGGQGVSGGTVKKFLTLFGFINFFIHLFNVSRFLLIDFVLKPIET